MLPLADAFAQLPTLWIFSMRAVDVGALLLSARLEFILQRRHCRVKDWPYSQAAIKKVCSFASLAFEVATLRLFVILGQSGCGDFEEALFELPLACFGFLIRLRRTSNF
jgi:hypothetical protein